MPVFERDIVPFPTVFGRNILGEVPNFVASPYLVVTMEDLWPHLAQALAGRHATLLRSQHGTVCS